MRLSIVATLLAVGASALLVTPAAAETQNVQLSGFEEVPVVLTDATGEFQLGSPTTTAPSSIR